MYGLAGTIENRSSIGIWCAYSAENPDPDGDDIWKVSYLGPGLATDGVDVDYIRVSDSRNYLCWAGGFGGVVKNPAWKTNKWVKVRQLVTTEIQRDRGRPTLAFLYMMVLIFGKPAMALEEAKSYDGGWREGGRGTSAVKAAIAEWESMIDTSNTSPIKTRRLPGF